MVRSALLFPILALLCALLPGCERPPVEVEQGGYRGVAIENVQNPRRSEALAEANRVPEPLPPVTSETPPASSVYKNVQVLGNLPAAEFGRLMAAITAWVAPEQGCNYCHAAGEPLWSDSMYTKVVARRMLQMTQNINAEWKSHVQDTGVTCYTCHRGMGVPANYWVAQPERVEGFTVRGREQNAPGSSIGLASLPSDPFTPFLDGAEQIRIQSGAALPSDNPNGIKDAEWTYGLMMHMSTSLGVNCTYCHNSRAFRDWDQSSPTRTTAWYGIRMARHVNGEYMNSLVDVFPDYRKGPGGDVFKVNCATCHQGLAKPLGGVSMLADYPYLADPQMIQAGTPHPGAGALQVGAAR